VRATTGPQGFHAVWLHGATRGGSTPQGLHYASSTDGATWSTLRTIATPTCECCWNRVVAASDLVGVLYRGGAPRDMMFTASRAGKWSAPVVAGAFDWAFEGCPHTGGALAAGADGASLHALVWTGKDGRAGLYYVGSSDRGKRWSDPKRLGGDDAVDSDLAIADDGTLVAAWDAKTGIAGSQSRDGGLSWSTPRALSPQGAVARHPRVVWTPSGFTTIWLHGTRASTTLRSNYGDIIVPAG
jgi:hypothetical protein